MTQPTVVRILVTLLVACLVVICSLLYMMIDRSVTKHYLEAEALYEVDRLKLLSSLVIHCPRDIEAEAALRILQERFPSEIAKSRGDTVEVGGIALVYRGSTLVDVNPF